MSHSDKAKVSVVETTLLMVNTGCSVFPFELHSCSAL